CKSRSLFAACFRSKRLYFDSTEQRPSFAVVSGQVSRSFVDYLRAVDITLVRSITPYEESVSTQHDTANTRVFIYSPFKLQSQAEARTLPGNPCDLVVEQFACDRFAIL